MVDTITLDLEQIESLYLKMSELLTKDLDKQWKEGKINGATYAEVYAKLMSGVVTGSMNTIAQLQMKETVLDKQLKAQQLANLQKDNLYKIEQINFTRRQTEGFNDNKKQKMLDIQMNAWAMMFSSGLLSEVPGIITNDKVSDLYCMLSDEVGLVPDPNDKCDPCSPIYDPDAPECQPEIRSK